MNGKSELKKLLDTTMQYAVMIHGKHKTIEDGHEESQLHFKDHKFIINELKGNEFSDEDLIELTLKNLSDDIPESLEIFLPNDHLVVRATSFMTTIEIDAVNNEFVLPDEVLDATKTFDTSKSTHSISINKKYIETILEQYDNGKNVIQSRFTEKSHEGLSFEQKIELANQLDATTEAYQNKERGR